MTIGVSITQNDIYTAMRSFIMGVITGVEVIRGLGNGVPTPDAPGYIAMTILFDNRLSTNINTYIDPITVIGTVNSQQNTQVTMQIDCYGPDSNEWAVILTTLLRDEYGCNALAPNVTPLSADDPRMIPLIDAEMDYEQRFMITALLQYNPVVSTPMQFFDKATIGIIEVDATYH